MQLTQWPKLEALFAQAIDLPEHERELFCDRACTNEPLLRDELRSLLKAHAATSNPLDQPPPLADGDSAIRSQALPEGTRLGVWRLGGLIRRGGAGEVYRASRADGTFEQTAALKLLYRDAAPDVQRFHAERQILAGLEHPGIARLLDGGVSDDGRLYAVVEYVDGKTLIEHCAERQAGLNERLDLFLQVCDAVAYAHRNLIVHRDLKPGNILVAPQGRIKLLDFGVAKRLDYQQPTADQTRAPYTPDYAAPEQLTGQPITTATDVYALGAVLFELLTGARPWRSKGLPIARIVQGILNEDAPLPSSVARACAPTPNPAPVPAQVIAGDLDAIVSTCLRKAAADRYSSVDALSRDIQRHLQAEPVTARGRSRGYVLGRALKRHRWSVAAAGLVFASLAIGLVTTAWQMQRAETERDAARRSAAREEAIRGHLTNLFRSSIVQKDATPVTAKTMLDRSTQRLLKEYRDDPQLAGSTVVTLADLYGALGDHEGQVPLLEGFLAAAGPEADRVSVALAQQKLAAVELMRGRGKRTAELLPQAEALWATAPDRYREQHLEALWVRGQLQRSQGDLDTSIATFRKAIAERSAYSGAAHSETASLHNSLAITLTGANRNDEALDAYGTTLDIYAKLGRSEEPDALVVLGNTGLLALRTGRLHEAEKTLAAAINKQRARSGDSAPVAASMALYGLALSAFDRHAEALANLRSAAEMADKYAGAASPVAIQNRIYLADALWRSGDLAQARASAEANLAVARERFGDSGVLAPRIRVTLARIALEAGNAQAAYEAFVAQVQPLRAVGKTAELPLALALLGTGEALLALGKPADAVAPLQEAVSMRERLLWSRSWELAAARASLGEALLQTKAPGAIDLLNQAAATLREQLGDDHPQLLRVKRVLAAPG